MPLHRNWATRPFAYGRLSALMKDNLYFVAAEGSIYSTPYAVVTEAAARPTAMIVVSAHRRPFSISAGGDTRRYEAAAIKPMAKRCEHAENAALIAFHIDPTHPEFRRFRGIGAPGVLGLDRNIFRRFDVDLADVYAGRLSPHDATRLFNELLAATLPHLPRTKPLDPRIERIIELLTQDHSYPLEELSVRTGLSYYRLSHLFAASAGISLRRFQMWLKARRAIALLASGMNVTQIAHLAGFADSAHMCRTFYEFYSAPPSYFLNPRHVNIHSLFAENVARTRNASSPRAVALR